MKPFVSAAARRSAVFFFRCFAMSAAIALGNAAVAAPVTLYFWGVGQGATFGSGGAPSFFTELSAPLSGWVTWDASLAESTGQENGRSFATSDSGCASIRNGVCQNDRGGNPPIVEFLLEIARPSADMGLGPVRMNGFVPAAGVRPPAIFTSRSNELLDGGVIRWTALAAQAQERRTCFFNCSESSDREEFQFVATLVQTAFPPGFASNLEMPFESAWLDRSRSSVSYTRWSSSTSTYRISGGITEVSLTPERPSTATAVSAPGVLGLLALGVLAALTSCRRARRIDQRG